MLFHNLNSTAEKSDFFIKSFMEVPLYMDINSFKYRTAIYPAMTAFTDQYSLPNIFFDIGQL